MNNLNKISKQIILYAFSSILYPFVYICIFAIFYYYLHRTRALECALDDAFVYKHFVGIYYCLYYGATERSPYLHLNAAMMVHFTIDMEK